MYTARRPGDTLIFQDPSDLYRVYAWGLGAQAPPNGIKDSLASTDASMSASSPQQAEILSRHIDVQIWIARTHIGLGRELRMK